ncbi:hypothetical protein ELH75_01205 [Rhizobium leguminosarum]|uniref:hypothetical protein n=1 Tax=Rhizobium leguminosarum TaxID=384 RepID=UPI00102F4662|nr:hypothetical protein [Rhizobium leguminosarum]TAX99803.1 hypothetical protein ELH95_00990 [Rhizobium leguminosarum]TAZ59948.1 hypothetical protein ELH75_01205 [Rhizobium leguminosarum]
MSWPDDKAAPEAFQAAAGTKAGSPVAYSSEAFKVADDFDRCLKEREPKRRYLCKIAYLIEIFRLVTGALAQLTKLVSINK